MAWRLAQSLVVLRGEVLAEYPGTTVYTIGDDEHHKHESDHNEEDHDDSPATPEVVCAVDIMRDDPALAERIATSGAPALKYVIHRQRIYWPGQGWKTHTGEYHKHIHVSVGRGPDGSADGPIDDPTPWLTRPAASTLEDERMFTIVSRKVAGSKTEEFYLCDAMASRPIAKEHIQHYKHMNEKGAIKLWNGGEVWDGWNPDLWGPLATEATAPAPIDYEALATALLGKLATR